jgi:hypothetical protein
MRLAGVAGLLLLSQLAACAREAPKPPPGGPGADEYAVWSAAVDAQFGDDHPRFVVAETTVAPEMEIEGGVERLRAESGVPPELLEDYVTRNGHPARVHAGRLHARRVRVLPAFGGPAGWIASMASDGELTVSRAGFDRGGTRALVTVSYTCGGMCGRQAMLMLERGRDGRWRHTRTFMEYVS